MGVIAIERAREIAKKYDLDGVIIIGIAGRSDSKNQGTHYATYGRTKMLCKRFGSVGEQVAEKIVNGEIKPEDV